MLDNIRKVTPEDVQSVAQRYFSDDQMTRAELDPLPLEGVAQRAPQPSRVKH
jgi:zinc protease